MEYVAYFQDHQYLVVHYCRLFDYSYFADNDKINNRNIDIDIIKSFYNVSEPCFSLF